MSQEHLAKLECGECKTTNYFSHRNKKKVKKKLEVKKHCSTCGGHTLHKEIK